MGERIPLQVGDVIKAGDVCRTILGEYIPAKGCVGRVVHWCEVGYVFRVGGGR